MIENNNQTHLAMAFYQVRYNGYTKLGSETQQLLVGQKFNRSLGRNFCV
jgi:hypothetical protein